jgi:beta-lactamase regulating signal transducer with metallopeptidase domain
LTYAVHSTVLIGIAWTSSTLLERFGRSQALLAVVRERLWKLALVGGLATATLQTALGGGAWNLAAALRATNSVESTGAIATLPASATQPGADPRTVVVPALLLPPSENAWLERATPERGAAGTSANASASADAGAILAGSANAIASRNATAESSATPSGIGTDATPADLATGARGSSTSRELSSSRAQPLEPATAPASRAPAADDLTSVSLATLPALHAPIPVAQAQLPAAQSPTSAVQAPVVAAQAPISAMQVPTPATHARTLDPRANAVEPRALTFSPIFFRAIVALWIAGIAFGVVKWISDWRRLVSALECRVLIVSGAAHDVLQALVRRAGLDASARHGELESDVRRAEVGADVRDDDLGADVARDGFRSELLRSGVGAHVRLYSAPRIDAPITLGLARPVICLPPRAEIELQRDELEALLAHELAHALRRDPVWLGACRAIEVLFFFQPLNRLARIRLADEAEYLCDDWAVRHTRERLPLASCLTEIASWIVGRERELPVPGMAARGKRLELRVRRLLEESDRDTARAPRWMLPLACCAVGAVALFAPGVSAENGATTSELARTSGTGEPTDSSRLLAIERFDDHATEDSLVRSANDEALVRRAPEDELEREDTTREGADNANDGATAERERRTPRAEQLAALDDDESSTDDDDQDAGNTALERIAAETRDRALDPSCDAFNASATADVIATVQDALFAALLPMGGGQACSNVAPCATMAPCAPSTASAPSSVAPLAQATGRAPTASTSAPAITAPSPLAARVPHAPATIAPDAFWTSTSAYPPRGFAIGSMIANGSSTAIASDSATRAPSPLAEVEGAELVDLDDVRAVEDDVATLEDSFRALKDELAARRAPNDFKRRLATLESKLHELRLEHARLVLVMNLAGRRAPRSSTTEVGSTSELRHNTNDKR